LPNQGYISPEGLGWGVKSLTVLGWGNKSEPARLGWWRWEVGLGVRALQG